MALIDCKNCGGKVSDKAETCPHCGISLAVEEVQPEEIVAVKIVCEDCGSELSEEDTVCPVCGCPVEKKEPEAEPSAEPIVEQAPKKSFGKYKILIILAALVVAVLVIIGVSENTLTGDDKVAYELIVDAAHNFKDPSSVRLVSGRVGVDKDCLFCGISAVNGFGARRTAYYFIMGGAILEEEDPDYLYTSTTELDIEKINKKLKKELGY